MKLRERHEKNTSIFTDSMADVSFLLVIFFMVTSVIAVSRGLDWQNPEESPDNQTTVAVEESIDILVRADGSLEVDRKSMAIARLLPYIQKVLEENPKKPVILRADPKARYASMMMTLDRLRQAPERLGFEIENLVIPTLREQDAWDGFIFD